MAKQPITRTRTSRTNLPADRLLFALTASLGVVVVLSAFVFGTGVTGLVAAKGGGSGGCPSSNAIGNFVGDSNITVNFTLDGTGSVATYTMSSVNESPSNGIPGLISYCVYPSSGTLPGKATAIAVGADGTPFTTSTGSSQGYFAFQRGNGNPSNLPLNGASNVVVGNASWTGGVPTNETIVLHINDPVVCNALYGGNPGTCFVLPGLVSPKCSVPNLAPDALRIPLPGPFRALSAGSTLTAEYEFAVVNYTSADLGAIVYVPEVDVHFPLASGGELNLTNAPQAIAVAGSGWSSAVAQTVTMNASTGFSLKHAWITTVNLAVMASGGPAGMTLEFRWGWISNNSSVVHQQWSSPSPTASLPYYPSVFVVAPYVGVISTSNTTATAGSFFGLTLGGAVSKTQFCITVETTNGRELHGQIVVNSGSSSTLALGVPLTFGNSGRPLTAGSYLIHIHDAMGAIIIQVALTVS